MASSVPSIYPGKVVSIYDFSLSQAWFTFMTLSNITSGFKVTGVFPVDKNVIKLSQGISLISAWGSSSSVRTCVHTIVQSCSN